MTHLLDHFHQLRKPRVLVVGDFMLDRYTWGDVNRISPEAPIPVLSTSHVDMRLGGAGSVCAILRGLDAEVTATGVIGKDTAGQLIRKLLTDIEIETNTILLDETRTTTSKERFVGRAAGRHPHQLLRVDQETTEPLDVRLESQLVELTTNLIDSHDVVLVSDYAKKTCSEFLLASIIERAKAQDIPILIDPASINCFQRYAGASIFTPNRIEASQETSQNISNPNDALEAARQLRVHYSFETVMITLDRDGIAVVDERIAMVVPTRPREVYDITGAGDVVLAVLGVCVVSGVPMVPSAQLANLVAGLEVEQFGVVPISPAQIRDEITSLESAT